MAKIKFRAADVLPLVLHSAQASSHYQPYMKTPGKPGLVLVKDDGIYLMSNGRPEMKASLNSKKNAVVYAEGFDPSKCDRDLLWDKTHAISGDDFAELIGLDAFAEVDLCEWVEISILARSMSVRLVGTRKSPPRAKRLGPPDDYIPCPNPDCGRAGSTWDPDCIKNGRCPMCPPIAGPVTMPDGGVVHGVEKVRCIGCGGHFSRGLISVVEGRFNFCAPCEARHYAPRPT